MMLVIFVRLLALWVLVGSSEIVMADVALHQAADHSVVITTGVYTAKIDVNGNLAELSVMGALFATQKFFKSAAASKVPTPFENVTVNVVGKLVAVRADEAWIEWTFGEDFVKVETAGFPFELKLDASVKMARIKDNGAASLAGKKFAGGGVIGMVLGNDRSVMFMNYGDWKLLALEDMRWGYDPAVKISAEGLIYNFAIHGERLFPACYTNGFGKAGDRTHFTLKLGVPADGAEFVGEVRSTPVGDSMEALNTGGNQGKGVVHFAKGVPIKFQTRQQNFGSKESGPLEYRWEIFDHYIWRLPFLSNAPAVPKVETAHRVVAEKRAINIPPGGEAVENWTIQELKPGFYYQSLTVWRDDRKLAEIPFSPFTVDLPHYLPKTTRPADFAAFWDAQEKLLKDTPFNPQLKRLTPEGAPAQLWELTGDMPGGKQLQALLEIPADWNGRNALLTATIQSGYDAALKAIAEGKWESKAKILTLSINAPENATYTRWTSATDHNLLENIQQWLRGVDYLKSRPDVKPGSIRLFGASRGGPLVLITAARRPQDIAGASGHVHTSCGISWTDKPYWGWGLPTQHNPKDTTQVAQLSAISAYVDPVNHAEYIVCPITFGYGISDFGLSPPEGIEAAYVLSKSPWKRISRDAGGHVYSDGMKQINKELDEFLGAQSGEGDQKRILTEH
jgi:cephalosporin-C deacetylase-like acetyl esterase